MIGRKPTEAPPIGPNDAPPPRRTKSLWEIYGPRRPLRLLMLALGALVVICGGALVPRIGRYPAGVDMCQWQLSQLGKILTGVAVEKGAYPDEGGAALLIGWRQNGDITKRRQGILMCSRDREVRRAESENEPDLYDSIDLTDREAIAALCSYAVRDFARYPVALDDEDAWLMCDRQGTDGRTRHHYGGINVLFADGRVRYLTKEDLDLDPARRIIVGPDSPHPELRKMIFFAAPRTDDEADGSKR